MDARVVRELGMEGRGHRSSLPDGDWNFIFIFAFGGEDFDAGADTSNLWGADEDHFQRTGSEFALADGALKLAPVGVPANGHVDCAEAGLLGIIDFCR